jgi:hypothetical protein
MSFLSSTELALLRTQPHRTKLWLSIYKPTTVFSAIAGAVAKGDRYIPYNTVSAGSYLNIKSGMTLYVGTTAGGNERGIIRVRSADSSELLVAENSYINWTPGDFLTVISFFEITALYPRIVANPDNELKPYWYKDYDITYTNQNSVLGSLICMGPHHAGFLDGGTHQVYYSASGTYNLKSEAMSYQWHFEGGLPTGSAIATPGWVSYDTPGHYTTTLAVTTGAGASDVSYRHISIYDRPADGSDIPIIQWSLENISGDVGQGGYSARIIIREDVSKDLIKDGALVVVFSDDWYGNIQQSLGGNAENRSNTVFTGYIQHGTIQWNYQDGYVSFDVVSVSELMKEVDSFSVSVESVVDPSSSEDNDENIPSAWVAVQNMDIQRAIYHYLKWHSTALLCNDFQFTATDQKIQYFNSNRESLFDAIQSIVRSGLVGEFGCDAQGKMWAVPSIESIDNPVSYFSPPAGKSIYHLDSQAWMGNPIIDEQIRPKVAYLELGGVAYYGPSTGTYNAFISAAPGLVPSYGGSVERIQGLALYSQSQLNTLTGNVYANRNAKYPTATFELTGNYRNFDIFPPQVAKITVNSIDTPRGISFTQKLFAPYSISWTYNPEYEFISPTIAFREITEGFDADTVYIPSLPPTDTDDGGSIDQPPIIVPPLPTPVLPPILVGMEFFFCTYVPYTGADLHTMVLNLAHLKTNSSFITWDATNTIIKTLTAGLYLVNAWITGRQELAEESTFYVDTRFRPCAAHIVGEAFNSGDPTGPDYSSYINGRSRIGLGTDGFQYASIPLSFPVLFADPVGSDSTIFSLDVKPSSISTVGASVLVIRISGDACTGCDCEQPGGG